MLSEYVMSSCRGENVPNHEAEVYLLTEIWNIVSTVNNLIPEKSWENLNFRLKDKKGKKNKVAL